VLAVIPVETDFAHPAGPGAEATCTDCGGGGTGGGSTSGPPPGLYITYSHFVQDFEGWLKGSPEFEYHILGQAGTSDSLKDYQCAGGSAGGYYHFDQNELSWSGSVLLFSQAQLNNYKTFGLSHWKTMILVASSSSMPVDSETSSAPFRRSTRT
jgi:hypothetical protein